MASIVYSNLSVIALLICLNVDFSTQTSRTYRTEYDIENHSSYGKRPQRFKRQVVINSPTKQIHEQRQPTVCGINSRSQNYINLTPNSTPSIDWPWIAGLLLKHYHEHFCGGALLNRNYVLTAAHCLHGKSVDDILVRLGEYDFTVSNETQYIDFTPSEIIIHQDYDSATQQHDIALIKFRKPIQYTDYIRPICLPPSEIPIRTNQTAIVAGWGTLFYGAITSSVLMEVTVPIWNLNSCIAKYSQPVFNTNICATGYQGGRDSCQGDSGGPLIVQQSNGRWINIGIVSWGIGCGNKELPGIYTNVKPYLPWINAHTLDAKM